MTARKRQPLRRDFIAAQLRGRVPEAMAWPDVRWRNDILGFARDVLGVEWLSEDQQKTLLAFQDNAHVSIRGGRKSGKTRSAAICAWWYVCTFGDARVLLIAPTENSVAEILWRDIKLLYYQARIKLGGEMHIGPQTGWRDSTRAIYGRVARDAGGIRGLSGANVCYMIDEASDVPDEIWETIDGNMAGGVGAAGRDSRALLISNPTRLQGFFYDSHFREARWVRIHMPALPRDDKPGMATAHWIDEKREDWGEQSARYAAHVRGDFPTEEEARVIQPALLDDAVARWDPEHKAGDLSIGVDPATSEKNDEATFAVRRGDQILCVRCYRGQSFAQMAEIVRGLLEEYRIPPRERARVVLDAEGPVGDGTMRELRPLASELGFRLVTLHYNDFRRKYPTLARSYQDLNGARWGAVLAAIRSGLGIPPDPKLRDELLFPTWLVHESGRRKIVPKDEFREVLHRSPDRADAVINACWGFDPAAEAEVERKWSSFGLQESEQATYSPYKGALFRQ